MGRGRSLSLPPSLQGTPTKTPHAGPFAPIRSLKALAAANRPRRALLFRGWGSRLAELGGGEHLAHARAPGAGGKRSRDEHAELISDICLLREAFKAGHCPGKKKAFVWRRTKGGRVLSHPGPGAGRGVGGGGSAKQPSAAGCRRAPRLIAPATIKGSRAGGLPAGSRCRPPSAPRGD